MRCDAGSTRRPGRRRSGWSTGGDYESEYVAIKAVSGRLGMTAETLRKWVRQSDVDTGQKPGLSTESARELRELRRKCCELEQTVELLKAATSFFVRERDPLQR